MNFSHRIIRPPFSSLLAALAVSAAALPVLASEAPEPAGPSASTVAPPSASTAAPPSASTAAQDAEAVFEEQLSRALSSLGLADAKPGALCRDRVRFHLDRWLQRPDLRQILARKEARWPMVTRELAARGLPAALGYLAFAESHFRDDARSPRSLGLWQFTEDTARRFGLVVYATADERLDPLKSTRAAAAYLAELSRLFGKDRPLLAIASYNLGEQQMRRTMDAAAAQGAADFWALYERKLLPAETAEYVPRTIAAIIVGENAHSLGLE